jgi:hypothetical protein
MIARASLAEIKSRIRCGLSNDRGRSKFVFPLREFYQRRCWGLRGEVQFFLGHSASKYGVVTRPQSLLQFAIWPALRSINRNDLTVHDRLLSATRHAHISSSYNQRYIGISGIRL